MTRLAAIELWFDWSIDAWPLLMAVLIGLACGLLGAVFLVRQAALLGDAVSHSVLPGIAVGILFSGLSGGQGEEVFGLSMSMLWVLGGALVAGLLATGLIEAFSRYSRLKSDTALGAVFPAFFAAGVILIEVVAGDAHIDSDCIFYGALELVDGFSKVVPTLIVAALVVLFLGVSYKEVVAASFDPTLARTLGVRVRLIDNVLVALLTATVVCAFEAVGAILVIAFLIIPPATAYLLHDRFHRMLISSAAIGMLSGVAGCWLTIVLGNLGDVIDLLWRVADSWLPIALGTLDLELRLETARAPTMAVVAGLWFSIVFLLAPRRGVIAQQLQRRALARRILDENVLGAVYRLSRRSAASGSEPETARVRLEAASDALRYSLPRLRPAVSRAVRRGDLVEHPDGSVSLTRSGTMRIEQILRAHRLWESYMTREMGAAPDHVHDAADRIEHYLQPALVEELDSSLERPAYDPHGNIIPPLRQRPPGR